MMRNRFRFFLSLIVSLLIQQSTSLASKTADSILVFNEIHYNPADDAKDSEWIEFHNPVSYTHLTLPTKA